MARLLLSTAEGTQAIDLRPVNSLGRHPNNSIQLLDKIVSKEHCIVELRETGYVLRDLGSLNGTYVNGERVRGEQALRHGDEIALGSTRARYDDGVGPMNFAMPAVGPGAILRGQPAPLVQATAPLAPPPQPPVAPQRPYGPPPGYPGSIPPPTSALQPSTPYGAPPSNFGAPPPPAFPQQPPPFGAPPQGRPPFPGMAPPLPPTRNPRAATRVDLLDNARAIGTQIAATTKDFLPFDQVVSDVAQLRVDYERLRVSWELTREIGLERDVERLLDKVLRALFTFVKADRGVILLKEPDGSLQPRATLRRDGSNSPIEVSSTILNHVVKEKAGVLTHDASQDFAASKGKSMILNRISSAIVVPLLHEDTVLGAVWLDSPALAQFQQKDLEVITSVANQAAMHVQNTLLGIKIQQEIVSRERFSRLLSPNVAEQVLSGKLEVKKGGTLVPSCTVFNSDIRGFTRMSEGTAPGIMVELLNEYFELMVETIFKYEGTLDKFMGDGIMAFWGAPAVQEDDAVHAVMCALEQMSVLAQFNRKRMELGQPPLAVGMGIHSGPLVAGYVGSSKALSYTVIGDTANVSARLCGIANAGQVLISEATLALVENRFEYEELPPAVVKGKEKALRIFNVLGLAG